MKLLVYLLQPTLIHMSVDLRCGDVGMAEHFLDHPQVGAMVQQMGGKGMTQEMRMHMLLQSGSLGALLNDLLYACCGEESPANAKKDMTLCLR